MSNYVVVKLNINYYISYAATDVFNDKKTIFVIVHQNINNTK